ncbi:hypothetical protein PISMIDRAFT_672411 [Pisolithus microcarpus 441]|uniref:Uncharacterized protein n=1 Tax=Pisolithus microcarpus 441 TaxID=765257 RepID=A0A0D0AAQ6_9AGAM|nr:hypothetical protein PISMIDRAFT_672411 [Pisolithus microcarpus 441]
MDTASYPTYITKALVPNHTRNRYGSATGGIQLKERKTNSMQRSDTSASVEGMKGMLF